MDNRELITSAPDFTLEGWAIMFVVFRNSLAVAMFETQENAVDYWRIHGGTIILYPDLGPDDVFIG